MNRLLIVTDSTPKAEALRLRLAPVFELQFINPSQMPDTRPDENLLIDIDLHNDLLFLEVRNWLTHRSRRQDLVFMVDEISLIDRVRSSELNATAICFRPASRKALLNALLGDFDALLLDPSRPPVRSYPGVGPALDALANIFASSRFGTALNLPEICNANDIILEHTRTRGLSIWLNHVRKHHSQTYQHSLLVVGVTAAFCQKLGFSTSDQGRMVLGAMFHDIGKVQIPVSVLEKPGSLDDDETSLMRKHPEHGFEALRSDPGIQKDTLDMVLHHHELLDGSGYPHRLPSKDIGDAVRILTICDIFSALIERRSYRDPMTCEAAFEVMLKMGSKLDGDLLAEFRFASHVPLAA
jgi:putative nucleotidyltransferase with HDIG domain